MNPFTKIWSYVHTLPPGTDLNIPRARRLSGFSVLALVLGWIGMFVGEHWVQPIFIPSVLWIGLGYLACLAIIPTGAGRLAGNKSVDGVDEFQLQARLNAHSKAYRWLFTIVLFFFAICVEANILLKLPLSFEDWSIRCAFVPFIGLGVSLPTWAVTRELSAWAGADDGDD